MFHGKKIAVVMPAYNAERTLEKTYREIPLDLVDEEAVAVIAALRSIVLANGRQRSIESRAIRHSTHKHVPTCCRNMGLETLFAYSQASNSKSKKPFIVTAVSLLAQTVKISNIKNVIRQNESKLVLPKHQL